MPRGLTSGTRLEITKPRIFTRATVDCVTGLPADSVKLFIIIFFLLFVFATFSSVWTVWVFGPREQRVWLIKFLA